MQLTDLHCKNFKPKNRAYKKADGRGLFILIKPNGSKLWRYKYRINKKEKLYSIGAYPEYSLVEAREIHRSLHKMVSEGKDPIEHEKEQKRKKEIENVLTFSFMAYEWLEKHKQEVKPQTFKEIEKRVKKYIIPVIGHIVMKDLTSKDFLMMIKEIEKRGTIELAKRIRQYSSQILRYALACEKVTRDFTLDIRGALIKPKTKHHPALITSEEVKEFLDALQYNDAGLNRQTRHGLEMLMLTFVRPIEMAGARWKEFNFDQKTWVIPAERMKMD
ncbi:Phage integrase family protein (fragment) [Tenacibaculum litopenaei]|uniref:tyrosine-type recombinase/integrase n=1 Tax=Tenacibaculum litopenaei TaxID=396016 RepID=UPI003895E6E8